MATYLLNTEEIQELFSQNPADKDKGGFQAFLVKLQGNCNRTTGSIELSAEDIGTIGHHASEFKKGGWQRKIKRIFERSLSLPTN